MSIRRTMGALIYDWVPFELRMAGVVARKQPEGWLQIRNRDERISMNGRGVQCLWRFSSDLHIANVFPSTSSRLLRRALARWPIAMRDAPAASRGSPRISFLIGHRGMERVPHLLATLQSIAGQSGMPIECIVIEQSVNPEIERLLPAWVRYVHTPLPHADLPYCRSWAFNVAVREARSDVVVLHDNDLLVPERYAMEACQRVDAGASFADLKRFVFYLDERDTAEVLAGGIVPRAVTSTVSQNLVGGSIVARRDAYDAIGGFDESFVGWGGEDNEFFERAAAHGGVNRFANLPMLHLYHAPQAGKGTQTVAGIERHRALQAIAPAERIVGLRARQQGRLDGPAIGE